MPINMSVEYPKLEDENIKLKILNSELFNALKSAKEIMTTYNLMKSKAGFEIEKAIEKATT